MQTVNVVVRTGENNKPKFSLVSAHDLNLIKELLEEATLESLDTSLDSSFNCISCLNKVKLNIFFTHTNIHDQLKDTKQDFELTETITTRGRKRKKVTEADTVPAVPLNKPEVVEIPAFFDDFKIESEIKEEPELSDFLDVKVRPLSTSDHDFNDCELSAGELGDAEPQILQPVVKKSKKRSKDEQSRPATTNSSNKGKISVPWEFPPRMIIHSQRNRALVTTDDYEDFYHELNESKRKLPFYEIVKFSNGVTLHCMKLAIGKRKRLVMASYDLRKKECDVCGAVIRFHSIFYHRAMHFFERYSNDMKCWACLTEFTSREVLERHTFYCQKKSELKPGCCRVCKKRYNTYDGLRLHEVTHYPEVVKPTPHLHVCEICSKECKTHYDLLIHQRHSHNLGAFICNECDKPYIKKSILEQHLISKHFPAMMRFTCDICSLPFAKSWSLKVHKNKVHVELYTAKCPVCDKVLKRDLKSHMASQHSAPDNRKKFPCPVCHKVFFQKSNLEQHQQLHLDPSLWEFECEHCQKKFSSKTKLTTHQKSHTQTVECELCKKYFKSKQYLKDHMNMHYNIQPYACPVESCGRKFSDRGNFRNHLKQHESNMGIKLTLTHEERRLKQHKLLNIELPGGLE